MIIPQIPKGFRDFLPGKMNLRKKIIGAVTEVFESFGFEPMDTPCLEYAETLEGKYGEEGDRLIYKFQDRGGRSVALRYDLTIPLSRVVATYPELTRPFKRYQIAPVWRADKPQKGRFREFYQCDIDIIGTESAYADGELVIITYLVLKKIGFDNFLIRINNRKLLNAFAVKEGINDRQVPSFFRSIDKYDKIGRDGVMKELQNNFTVSKSLETKLDDYIFSEENRKQTGLSEIAKLVEGMPAGDEGLRELETIRDSFSAYGVPEKYYMFDFSLARGLDYYTGPIFETIVTEPRIGSITGGGRYDNLIGLFSRNPVPATGTSFGLERIVTVLDEMGIGGSDGTMTRILVTLFDADLMADNLRIAKTMREADLNVEVYFSPQKLKKQLSYAANRGIPFVVIQGPDEISQGTITLRNMNKGTQEVLSLGDLISTVKNSVLQ